MCVMLRVRCAGVMVDGDASAACSKPTRSSSLSAAGLLLGRRDVGRCRICRSPSAKSARCAGRARDRGGDPAGAGERGGDGQPGAAGSDRARRGRRPGGAERIGRKARERRRRPAGSGRGGALVPPCGRAGARRGRIEPRRAVRERRGRRARSRRGREVVPAGGGRRPGAGAADARAHVPRGARRAPRRRGSRALAARAWPSGASPSARSISLSCISMASGSRGTMPRAAALLAAAAARGHPVAQNNLALLYAAGRGVPRDPKLAAKWHEKAASQGLANAQYQLGLLYEAGRRRRARSGRGRPLVSPGSRTGREPGASQAGSHVPRRTRRARRTTCCAFAWLDLAAAKLDDQALRERAAPGSSQPRGAHEQRRPGGGAGQDRRAASGRAPAS